MTPDVLIDAVIKFNLKAQNLAGTMVIVICYVWTTQARSHLDGEGGGGEGGGGGCKGWPPLSSSLVS